MSYPLRGEIWDIDFRFIGLHPGVVMSANPLIPQLRRAAVIPITGTQGPPATHVTLTADTGLTRYDESYADVTELISVRLDRFRRKRGELARVEMVQVENQLIISLGMSDRLLF